MLLCCCFYYRYNRHRHYRRCASSKSANVSLIKSLLWSRVKADRPLRCGRKCVSRVQMLRLDGGTTALTKFTAKQRVALWVLISLSSTDINEVTGNNTEGRSRRSSGSAALLAWNDLRLVPVTWPGLSLNCFKESLKTALLLSSACVPVTACHMICACLPCTAANRRRLYLVALYLQRFVCPSVYLSVRKT